MSDGTKGDAVNQSAEVRRLHQDGLAPEMIASCLGMPPSKVRRAITGKRPPKHLSAAARQKRDGESPSDISSWESYSEGGVVRWHKPR